MTTAFGCIPFPAEASRVDKWADTDTQNPSRYWETPRMLIPCDHGDVAAFVAGFQHADGTVEPEIGVNQLHSDHPITAQQARR